ncbi:uncharacterized protein LOC116666942 isoform X1 [Camelus ferus]|uniref:Uncharacterized protein LOC116666942 isoform X1 n=1 Tax=Camelus ferus TaxID=419612 RepID=A0A8B8TWB2_CAMFR|nr:uncharacterized protein LOC116666942 isoform X1 [Camelus ferus]
MCQGLGGRGEVGRDRESVACAFRARRSRDSALQSRTDVEPPGHCHVVPDACSALAMRSPQSTEDALPLWPGVSSLFREEAGEGVCSPPLSSYPLPLLHFLKLKVPRARAGPGGFMLGAPGTGRSSPTLKQKFQDCPGSLEPLLWSEVPVLTTPSPTLFGRSCRNPQSSGGQKAQGRRELRINHPLASRSRNEAVTSWWPEGGSQICLDSADPVRLCSHQGRGGQTAWPSTEAHPGPGPSADCFLLYGQFGQCLFGSASPYSMHFHYAY